MKIVVFALLVAGVASASVSSHSSEQSSLKERSNLKDATVGEVAAALKLLARERPHQSFLQNDLEEVFGHKDDYPSIRPIVSTLQCDQEIFGLGLQ